MTSFEPAEKAVIRQLCESSLLFFTRYFFKQRFSAKFRVNWHHKLIAQKLEDVANGKIKNLLINVAPGSSKTEIAIINFIAWCLANNPRCRFLHISYSDDLALLNSQTCREIVSSDEYQEFWQRKVADDAKAKKRWNIELDGKKAGGVYAASLGGQITGFRAGYMTEGFSGAILIDDPLKPEDAHYKVKRDAANRKLITTVKSRKANPDTPIILIMQRLAEDDPTGFIQRGEFGGDWDIVKIPALITDDEMQALGYTPPEVVKDEHGRFSYWQYKEPLDIMLETEQKNRFLFSSQYQQTPAALGGNVIKTEWLKFYRTTPKLTERHIFADTAQKTGERNDYSVFQCWGKGEDSKLYLIDQIRGKWEAPELKRQAVAFWNKHKAANEELLGTLRSMRIEDKASGTGLIQDIKREASMPVYAIQRNKDKLTRVLDVLSYIEAGYVYILESASYLSDFLSECEAFTSDNTHAHDDQIDPMCDAISHFNQPKAKANFEWL